MDTMAPTRPSTQRPRRISLTAEPAAASAARREVAAAIRSWHVPVDAADAALLTSELVTNAICHQPGETVTLAITCACDKLRVDVADTSSSLPIPVDAEADAETGRGLMLVSALAADWGFYRTRTGKAVYFTLAFADDRETGDRMPRGARSYAR